MAWSERIDNLKWTPLKGVAEGVSITKLLGISFDKGSSGSHELRWSVATIRPGGRFSFHAHPHPQCFYFVTGRGQVALADGVIEVGPGSIVTVGDREGHEVRNTGDGEMFLMEVSLFHAAEAVPVIEPHPAVAEAGELQVGLAERLHGAVVAGVRRLGDGDGEGRRARGAATWIRALRPFSFTASIVSVLLGTALGALAGGFHPWLAVVALLGAVALHAGSNLISDYYDFVNGVDAADAYGSSGVLPEGLLHPREVLMGGLVAFGVASAAGAYLAAVLGPVILVSGGIGLVGGIFYTARPLAYKYRALGDLGVFVLFGPLTVLGAYFVQAGALAWAPLLVAVPVGMLVTAILHANNLRDVPFDRRAGIRTLAMLLGTGGSRALYAGLVVGAYLLVAGFVASGILPLVALAVLLSAPLAARNLRLLARAAVPAELATADVMTAQLHMVFGVLLTAGVVLGPLL